MIPRTQLVVALIAAFLFGTTLGLVSGIAGAHFMLGWSRGMEHRGPMEFHRFLFPPGRPGEPGGPGGPPMVVFRLERALDLKPAQRDSIASILTRSRGRFAALRESLRSEIGEQLTPAQREEWKRMERHMEAWHGPWSDRFERRRP